MSASDRLRTMLANERTLLAYIRTALALLVFGMAAIKFFPDTPVLVSLGWLFMAAGLAVFIWGVSHFRRVSTQIQKD
ncbi:MAG: hypothetical protein A2Z88_05385 [Omnitrophica WOR_2 bacterium GWA2_47_8]|nr:MAG: hypothetical protein A2Z88_05385 [Omnitrophica WOR_2 bacterium GWA2_47_8]